MPGTDTQADSAFRIAFVLTLLSRNMGSMGENKKQCFGILTAILLRFPDYQTLRGAYLAGYASLGELPA